MLKTSERIRYARHFCCLTTRQLAHFIGVSEKSIIRYENGPFVPDSYSLIKLATVSDLSTDYLLGISDNAKISFLEPYRTKNIFYRTVKNNLIQ